MIAARLAIQNIWFSVHSLLKLNTSIPSASAWYDGDELMIIIKEVST
jgi:hypothetical protein